MSFQVPYESSSPATPGTSRRGRSFLSDMSTTPAGPPPSSVPSFTSQQQHPPAARPPLFGGFQNSPRSRPGEPGKSIFGQSGGIENDSIFNSSIGSTDFSFPPPNKGVTGGGGGGIKSFSPARSHGHGALNGNRFGASTGSAISDSFPLSQMSDGSEEEDMQDDDVQEESEEDDGEGDEADGPMDTMRTSTASNNLMDFMDSQISEAPGPAPAGAGAGIPPSFGQQPASTSVFPSFGNSVQPKLARSSGQSNRAAVKKLQPVPENTKSPFKSILRDFASRSRVARVDETGEVILRTEDNISRIYDDERQVEHEKGDFNATLSEVSAELVEIWDSIAEQENGISKPFDGGSSNIGPGDGAPKFVKAAYLGGLLMQIHHTPFDSLTSGSLPGHGLRSLVPVDKTKPTPSSIPKFLIDWLDENHALQVDDAMRSLGETEPNPTASSNFFDIINTAVLRGRLSEASDLLRLADFSYARSALEDGLPQAGYRGVQLQNIQRCINKVLQVLEACPCILENDWDVKGPEWDLYRRRVIAALTDLEDFAEGEEKQVAEPPSSKGPIFQADHFGLGYKAPPQNNNFSFTQFSRMAESRVPWAIYQNVRSIYRILLGDVEAITTHAQDWVEATIGLTVWWDGDEVNERAGKPGNEGLRASRGSRSADILNVFPSNAFSRDVDINPENAYLDRLRLSFSNVTRGVSSDTSFRVNTLSSLEVGLASIFEGDVDGVLGLLQTWSLCVASSVVEVASAGGWLETAGGGDKSPSGLNEDDLMVLSYGQDDSEEEDRHVSKDDILSTYASGLSDRATIEAKPMVRDGWEVALEVLSRLDETERMQKAVGDLVDKLPLDTSEQMDKVVLLCSELGMDKEGRRVSEVSAVPVDSWYIFIYLLLY